MNPTAPAADSAPAEPADSRYGRVRLAAGLVGRAWLWFLVGCLVVTLVPMLFGWRPYLIESGSMAPRINVGDVVIASPEQDPQVLLGRVAVFNDPDHPDRNKTHRVVRIADDSTLVTKGDANPTEDSAHVAVAEVHGLGRLLVMFVGLPVVWAQTGQWLWLLLFLVGTALAVRWVGRDHEDDEDEGSPPPDGSLLADAPVTASKSSFDIAATRPPAGLPRLARVARLGRRLGYGAALVAALLLPTSTAAFSATTRSAGNSWTAVDLSYTTEVQDLDPWLYWKLDETGNGGTADDSSGNNRDGHYRRNGGSGYFDKGITGALVSDTPNMAVTLTDSDSCINSKNAAETTGPGAFTEIVWFKATPGYDQGGKLLGFERPRTGVDEPSDGQYDRMLYLDGDARLRFGVYNGGYHVLSSPDGLDDGAWHMAVGTMGNAGMALYVDGQLVDSNNNSGAEANASGWWRAGCGNLAGWGGAGIWDGPNRPPGDSNPTNYPFLGSLDEVAVWTKALTASQVAYLYFAR